MAKTTASTEIQTPADNGSGVLGLVMALLIATVVAGTGGALFGMYGIAPSSQKAEKSAGPVDAHKPVLAGKLNLKMLSPIITNLGGPPGTWVRLEAAIVTDKENVKEEAVLAGKIAEDIVAFLRTVPLAHIEGANGFQHLREDINDRARIRSEGKVREVIIQSLIVE